MGDCGGNFDSVEQNSFLSLENDVLGPLDESGQISLGLYVVTSSEVARSFLEEGVGLLFNFLSSLFGFLSFSAEFAELSSATFVEILN